MLKKKPLRLSINLGAGYTRVQRADKPTPIILPTVLSNAGGTWQIGRAALEQRHVKQQVWPLKNGFIHSQEDCLTYLKCLRAAVAPEQRATWAVISAPSLGQKENDQVLGHLASQVFDQALVVPELTLAVFAMKQAGTDYPGRMVLLNLGHACIQTALVKGIWPEPKEIFHLAGGGHMLDLTLRDGIRDMAPDLKISLVSARNLKESFSPNLGAPAPVCLVEVVQKHQRRILDISPAMLKAVDSQVAQAVKAVDFILKEPGSLLARTYGKKIVLLGGGGGFPGLAQKVFNALREKDYPVNKVIVPEDPANLAVRGGRLLVERLLENHWEVLT